MKNILALIVFLIVNGAAGQVNMTTSVSIVGQPTLSMAVRDSSRKVIAEIEVDQNGNFKRVIQLRSTPEAVIKALFQELMQRQEEYSKDLDQCYGAFNKIQTALNNFKKDYDKKYK